MLSTQLFKNKTKLSYLLKDNYVYKLLATKKTPLSKEEKAYNKNILDYQKLCKECREVIPPLLVNKLNIHADIAYAAFYPLFVTLTSVIANYNYNIIPYDHIIDPEDKVEMHLRKSHFHDSEQDSLHNHQIASLLLLEYNKEGSMSTRAIPGLSYFLSKNFDKFKDCEDPYECALDVLVEKNDNEVYYFYSGKRQMLLNPVNPLGVDPLFSLRNNHVHISEIVRLPIWANIGYFQGNLPAYNLNPGDLLVVGWAKREIVLDLDGIPLSLDKRGIELCISNNDGEPVLLLDYQLNPVSDIKLTKDNLDEVAEKHKIYFIVSNFPITKDFIAKKEAGWTRRAKETLDIFNPSHYSSKRPLIDIDYLYPFRQKTKRDSNDYLYGVPPWDSYFDITHVDEKIKDTYVDYKGNTIEYFRYRQAFKRESYSYENAENKNTWPHMDSIKANELLLSKDHAIYNILFWTHKLTESEGIPANYIRRAKSWTGLYNLQKYIVNRFGNKVNSIFLEGGNNVKDLSPATMRFYSEKIIILDDFMDYCLDVLSLGNYHQIEILQEYILFVLEMETWGSFGLDLTELSVESGDNNYESNNDSDKNSESDYESNNKYNITELPMESSDNNNYESNNYESNNSESDNESNNNNNNNESDLTEGSNNIEGSVEIDLGLEEEEDMDIFTINREEYNKKIIEREKAHTEAGRKGKPVETQVREVGLRLSQSKVCPDVLIMQDKLEAYLKENNFRDYHFQVERGKKTQRLHIQGCAKLPSEEDYKNNKTEVRFKLRARDLAKKLNNDFPGIAVTPITEDYEKYKEYCKKSDTRIAECKPRSKYEESEDEEEEETKNVVFNNPYGWQKELLDKLFGPVIARRILVIIGFEGNEGKTLLQEALASKYPSLVSRIGWDGSNGGSGMLYVDAVSGAKSKIVLINIPRSQSNMFEIAKVPFQEANLRNAFAAIESIKDGAYQSIKYESKFVKRAVKPHVVLFTNHLPPLHYLSADRWELYRIGSKSLNLIKIEKEQYKELMDLYVSYTSKTAKAKKAAKTAEKWYEAEPFKLTHEFISKYGD